MRTEFNVLGNESMNYCAILYAVKSKWKQIFNQQCNIGLMKFTDENFLSKKDLQNFVMLSLLTQGDSRNVSRPCGRNKTRWSKVKLVFEALQTDSWEKSIDPCR